MTQVPAPMKAADLSNDVDLTRADLGLSRFFTDRFVMERKYDGCRVILELEALERWEILLSGEADHDQIVDILETTGVPVHWYPTKDAAGIYEFHMPKGAVTKEVRQDLCSMPGVDGLRQLTTLNRIWSRGRDVSDHFPHLQHAYFPGNGTSVSGMMLDGELLAVGPDGQVLSAATSLLNSLTNNAVQKQKQFGPAWFVAFDVLSMGEFSSRDIMRASYFERRLVLQVAVTGLEQPAENAARRFFPGFDLAQSPISLAEAVPASAEAIESFRDGEGFMIKDQKSSYHQGARSGGWYKFKWLSTADGFITGFKPGKNSLTGTVGSVILSLQTGDGTTEVAHVGVFTNAFRHELTAPDGSLKKEYYGKVMEFACQGIGTGGLARHPRYVQMRPDKTAADCILEEQIGSIPKV